MYSSMHVHVQDVDPPSVLMAIVVLHHANHDSDSVHTIFRSKSKDP